MTRICLLCRKSDDNELKYGKLMKKKEVVVHYFCLLLTSNLIQRGKDSVGFLGFLPSDIKREAQRIANDVCHYCRQKSANIACCAKKCQHRFHLSCGLENRCVNQFIGTFRSFCHRHTNYEKKLRPPLNEVCSICYEQLGKYCKSQIFRSPCCKTAWFHRWCLANLALYTGYFFKCPLCNNVDVFRPYFLRRSIYIPDQDAAWEREPNAFNDLLERPDTCNAENCMCPYGRNYTGSCYKLLICETCGAEAIHKCCMVTAKSTFNCKNCEFFNETIGSREQDKSVEGNAGLTENESEFVDVVGCDNDDGENSNGSTNSACSFLRVFASYMNPKGLKKGEDKTSEENNSESTTDREDDSQMHLTQDQDRSKLEFEVNSISYLGKNKRKRSSGSSDSFITTPEIHFKKKMLRSYSKNEDTSSSLTSYTSSCYRLNSLPNKPIFSLIEPSFLSREFDEEKSRDIKILRKKTKSLPSISLHCRRPSIRVRSKSLEAISSVVRVKLKFRTTSIDGAHSNSITSGTSLSDSSYSSDEIATGKNSDVTICNFEKNSSSKAEEIKNIWLQKQTKQNSLISDANHTQSLSI